MVLQEPARSESLIHFRGPGLDRSDTWSRDMSPGRYTLRWPPRWLSGAKQDFQWKPFRQSPRYVLQRNSSGDDQVTIKGGGRRFLGVYSWVSIEDSECPAVNSKVHIYEIIDEAPRGCASDRDRTGRA